MLKRTWSVTGLCCIAGMVATLARGQTPTLSVEATEINYSEIFAGPSSILTVQPGDILRVKIRLRDWSPTGSGLRGYQVMLDPSGFESGSAGNVEPVQYRALLAADTTNEGNAFIEQDDPDFIFFGLHPLAMTETMSAGYRWMGVLLKGGIASPQDGTRFTVGEVSLQVSDDAEGTFIISLYSQPGFTYLRDVNKNLIEPLDTEPLTLFVGAGAAVSGIASGVPRNGDVNDDGVSDSLDVFAIVDALNGVTDLPAWRIDVDRDGVASAADVLAALEVFMSRTPGSGGLPRTLPKP